MNSNRLSALVIILVVVLCFNLISCNSSYKEVKSEPEQANNSVETKVMSEYYFYGSVVETESDFGGILVKPESDILPNELVVHSDGMPVLKVGDRVLVEYGGQITLSFPGQIFGAKVTVLK
jgi:hypothetical protein